MLEVKNMADTKFKCLGCGKTFKDYKIRYDYRKVDENDYDDVYVCPFCNCEDFKTVPLDEQDDEPKKVILNPNSCCYCLRRSFVSSSRCAVTQKLVSERTPICKYFEFDEHAYQIDKEFFENGGR